MQTFLPYPDFDLSARCLDRQRLGKQRVEAFQILKILAGISMGKGWKNHPATKMWRGHGGALLRYFFAVGKEWERRGYANFIYNTVMSEPEILKLADTEPENPTWLGDDEFHLSHQSNLLRKNPEYYKQFSWDVDSSKPYIWPS